MPRRYNASEKSKAVLRVLKGERGAAVALELGVGIDRLERWESTFLSGARAALEEKARRKTLYGTLKSNSKGISQWAGLLVALAAAVLFLVRFLNRDSGQ